MRLAKFTESDIDRRYIYINPEHVVAVEQFNSSTLIVTTATGSDGASRCYVVKEAMVDVVSVLSV